MFLFRQGNAGSLSRISSTVDSVTFRLELPSQQPLSTIDEIIANDVSICTGPRGEQCVQRPILSCAGQEAGEVISVKILECFVSKTKIAAWCCESWKLRYGLVYPEVPGSILVADPVVCAMFALLLGCPMNRPWWPVILVVKASWLHHILVLNDPGSKKLETYKYL